MGLAQPIFHSGKISVLKYALSYRAVAMSTTYLSPASFISRSFSRHCSSVKAVMVSFQYFPSAVL